MSGRFQVLSVDMRKQHGIKWVLCLEESSSTERPKSVSQNNVTKEVDNCVGYWGASRNFLSEQDILGRGGSTCSDLEAWKLMISSWKDEFSVIKVLGFRGGGRHGEWWEMKLKMGWGRCWSSFIHLFYICPIGSRRLWNMFRRQGHVQILLRKINRWWCRGWIHIRCLFWRLLLLFRGERVLI